ncbi:hypothetical protein HK405_000792, partial [Cladochytrium tenue]
MAEVRNIPTEILCEVMKAYADVGDGEFGDNGGGGGRYISAWPGKRICRIEATLGLFRLRLVCRRWRDAIQSDCVARHVFGACLPVTDLLPDTTGRSNLWQSRVSHRVEFGHKPYAWCHLFDGAMVAMPEDPWEDNYEENPNDGYRVHDALGDLWMKPLYRQPP